MENGCDLLRRNSEGKVAIEIWAESYAALVRRFDAAVDTPDYVWDQYEISLKMSTYLLAFVISDFEFITGVHTGNNVTFRIWSRSEALNQTKYAAEIGPKILQYYEDYFNVAFPLPKQVG